MDTSEWVGRVGESWAAEYRRTDRSFTQLTEQLLARTRDFTFSRVLDIGCGAGELSLAIARGRPDATVAGIDISPALIDVATKRGSDLANVTFEVADASTWISPQDAAPDLLVSRHGVMFFDDPVTAFRNLREAGSPSAGLLFSCFRARDENPFFSEVDRLLPAPAIRPDPESPGPFAFADPARIRRILADAGWTNIDIAPLDFAMIAGLGADAVEDAVSYFSRIGPAAGAMAELDTASRERCLGRIRDLAERYHHENVVALPAAAWIVSASKT